MDPATDRPGGGLSTDAAWQRGRRARGGRSVAVETLSKLRKDCHKEVGREEAAQSQWVAKHVSKEYSTLSGCAVDWGTVDMESAPSSSLRDSHSGAQQAAGCA